MGAGAGSGVGAGAETFDPTRSGREVGSTWLVVSGPPGSKVVETYGAEAEARLRVGEMIARGVDAEVREMVTLSFSFALRVDVERAGREDAALLSMLLAKGMLRVTDGALEGALAGREEKPEASVPNAPKIVVPRLVLGPGKGRRG